VLHLDTLCDGLAPCGMVPPCKACPVPLTAPRDGGPARGIDSKHPARLAPRFLSGTGIVGTETKHPPSHPVPCSFHEKKERVQASHVVRWRISIFLCPQRRIFFYAGTSVDIDILPVVWPCHSPLAAVAARGLYLTPAHFPPALPLLPPDSCAYRKSGSNLFCGGSKA
jgi:hypothetical protein